MDSASPRSDLILQAHSGGVTTLTMNMPRRLNGWTMPMMEALASAMNQAATDDATKVVILTGTDPYYCAGVNLSATLQISHPKVLHAGIVEHNQALFDRFIDFPKPIIAAVNGPRLGRA